MFISITAHFLKLATVHAVYSVRGYSAKYLYFFVVIVKPNMLHVSIFVTTLEFCVCMSMNY